MKNIKTRIAAATVSTMMIAATFLTMSALSASAKTEVVNGDGEATQSIVNVVNNEARPVAEKTTKTNALAKAYYFKALGKTSKGYDWTYKTDKDNINVKCKYDFKAHKYTFKLTGKAKGKTNFTLMYKTDDKTWKKVPMKLTVDAQKNIIRTA